jgi:hypothetical protein
MRPTCPWIGFFADAPETTASALNATINASARFIVLSFDRRGR